MNQQLQSGILTIHRIFLLNLFIFVFLFSARSQDSVFVRNKYPVTMHTNPKHTFPNRFWVDGSVGLAFLGNKTAELSNNYGGNLHYLSRHYYHYQVRYNHVYNFVPLAIGTGNGFQKINEFGYMVGALLVRKDFLAEIALGPSIVSGVRRGAPDYTTATGYKSEKFVQPGISAELDIKFMARRYAGIGLVVKANGNRKLSFVSLGIELTLNGPN